MTNTPPRTDTRKATETLKGLAIIAVLINHYLNDNFSSSYGGFANTTISIFFLLSGYGIYSTLNKRFPDRNFSWQVLGSFYYDRLIRIFPLFWLALVIQTIVTQKSFSWGVFVGISSIGAEHFWFIAYILQCYLISPILFWLLRFNPKIALGVATLSLILSHRFFSSAFVGDRFGDIINWFGLDYRDIYCLHIYLFFLGMCFVPFKWIFRSKIVERARSQTLKPEIIVFFGLVLIFFLVMLAYKIFNIKFLGDSWLLALFALIGLTIYTTRKNIYFQYLVFIGEISYAIYLFHKSFFYSFDLVPITANSVWLKLLAVAIFFPIFLICCIKLEKLGAYCSKILKKYNPFVRSQITV
jgi:peptidoglycan/LPS O-acetylase OafA/YrhL